MTPSRRLRAMRRTSAGIASPNGDPGRFWSAAFAMLVLAAFGPAAWADNLLVGSGGTNNNSGSSGGAGTVSAYGGPGSGGGASFSGTTTSVASPSDINANITYDYVGIGTGGTGGGGGGYSSAPGGAGVGGGSSALGISGGATLTVSQSLYVGGGGGGGGGAGGSYSPGGSGGTGGDGTLGISGATLTVSQNLYVGGGGGGGGGAGGSYSQGGAGGAGGAGKLTATSGATLEIAGQLTVGGIDGSGPWAWGAWWSPPGGGGAGGLGVFNLGDGSSLTFTGASPSFTITNRGTLNLGNATPGGATAGTVSGITSLTNNGVINFNQSDAASYIFSTHIAGTGSINQNSSSRTTILSGGVGNTYTGPTNVNAGKLQAGAVNTFGNNSAVSVNAGAIFDLINLDQAIGSLADGGGGGGSVTLGSATLTTGGNNTSTTFSGVITGTGGLTKTGTGTQTLEGNNLYTGATHVSAGTLALSGSGAIAASAGLTLDDAAGVGFDISGTTSGATIKGLNGGGTSGGNVALGNQTLTVADSGSYAGVISGAGGGLTKTGTGTLTLSGVNTYGGSTTVSAGTLALSGSGAIAASAGLTLDDAAGVGFDISGTTSGATIKGLNGGGTSGGNVALGNQTLTVADSGSYAGVISGAGGGLTKTGTGTLTLSGVNTYGGSTTVSAGTLALSGSGTLGDADNGNVTVSGGTLNLGGTSQTKNTTITLTDGAINNGTLNSSGGFVVQKGSIGATLTGGATLTKTGTGTLTLFGVNTYTGSTTVSAGTLALSGSGAIAASAGLTLDDAAGVGFDISGTTSGATIKGLNGGGTSGGNVALGNQALTVVGSGSYAGVISGAGGGLTKTGTGTLTLSGVNTYGGATTVSADKLIVDGTSVGSEATVNGGSLIVGSTSGSSASFGGGVAVNGGGMLGGHGSIGGAVSVADGGTLSPGNSIGTLTVGSLNLANGSTTRIELNDGGNTAGTNNDFIHVTGAASIADGAVVHVSPENGTDNGSTYAANTKYTILTADGGLTVSGAQTITDDYAYLNFTSSHDANHYYVTSRLVATTFCTSGMRRNQCGAADAAFKLDDGNPVYDKALNLATGQTGPAFTSLFGAQYVIADELVLRATRQFHGLLAERMNGAHNGDGIQSALTRLAGVQLADNGGDLVGLANAGRDGFWLRALADTGRIGGDGNGVGADTTGNGIALGADRRFADDTLAGIAFAYGQTKADMDQGLGGLTLDSYQLAAYVRWQDLAGMPGTYLNASVSYGAHKLDAGRNVAFLQQRAIGGFDAQSYGVSLEVGHAFPLPDRQATLTPYAGITAAHVARDGFAERASDAALAVRSGNADSLRTGLGLRAAWQAGRFAPSVDVAWVHEFGDRKGTIDAAFASLPDVARFAAVSPQLDRDRLALKLGLTAWRGRDAQITIGYAGEFVGSDRNHTATAAARWTW